MNYNELRTLAKIAYVRYKEGAVTSDDLNILLSDGKLNQEEINFIIGS